jgi:hypothetical protein
MENWSKIHKFKGDGKDRNVKSRGHGWQQLKAIFFDNYFYLKQVIN